MNKKGIEMVISTLIVIILSLFLLVLGLLLIRTSTCKAIEGVTSISDLSMQEIQRLFSEQDNTVAVKELSNEIHKGVYYGVGFVIENDGATPTTQFNYNVNVIDLGDCQITQSAAEDYMVAGKSGTANIPAGTTYPDVVEFMIPSDAPSCVLKYRIDVTKNNQVYGSSVFNIVIKQTSWFNSALC